MIFPLVLARKLVAGLHLALPAVLCCTVGLAQAMVVHEQWGYEVQILCIATSEFRVVASREPGKAYMLVPEESPATVASCSPSLSSTVCITTTCAVGSAILLLPGTL
jgi:hypothetical protein